MATSPIYNWPEPDNTDLVKNGALAMRTLGDAIDTTMATMTPKSIVDAKGDLIAASAADTPARLAVGANGETIVADSSTATGLRYTGNFAAGKNKIINGDINVNQRAFTSSTATGYTVDRFRFLTSDGTCTASVQAFTAGTAPVTGYEAKQFLRAVTSGQTAASAFTRYQQSIESVRTFANENATISFWAKAASGTPKIAVELNQSFGTGGSAAVNTYAGQVTLSTSWTRYSVTIAVPSISGKTVGTDSDSLGIILFTSAGTDFNARTGSLGIQSATIDIWGLQAESGSVATAFQTATGTIQGELAACQRYYWRISAANGGNYANYGSGIGNSTTQAQIVIQNPVPMRITPTSLDYSTLSLNDTATITAVTSATLAVENQFMSRINVNVASGLTQYRPYLLFTNNNSAGYLGFSAEL